MRSRLPPVRLTLWATPSVAGLGEAGPGSPTPATTSPAWPRGPALQVVIAGAALLVAGCSALKPVPETTRYYTLVPPTQAAVPAMTEPDAVRVGVRVTAQTDYLRRPPIAVRIGTNELRFAEGHRWGERVDEGTERALTLALQARLKNVVLFPVSHGAASGTAVVIDVVVAACEGTNDGATFESYWRLNVDTETAPVASGHFRQTRGGWDGENYGQLAGMLGALVDELAAEIAPAVEATSR